MENPIKILRLLNRMQLVLLLVNLIISILWIYVGYPNGFIVKPNHSVIIDTTNWTPEIKKLIDSIQKSDTKKY